MNLVVGIDAAHDGADATVYAVRARYGYSVLLYPRPELRDTTIRDEARVGLVIEGRVTRRDNQEQKSHG